MDRMPVRTFMDEAMKDFRKGSVEYENTQDQTIDNEITGLQPVHFRWEIVLRNFIEAVEVGTLWISFEGLQDEYTSPSFSFAFQKINHGSAVEDFSVKGNNHQDIISLSLAGETDHIWRKCKDALSIFWEIDLVMEVSGYFPKNTLSGPNLRRAVKDAEIKLPSSKKIQ